MGAIMGCKGVIGFSAKRRNWISRIIKWFTRSRWSHTFVVYQDSPETLVMEAGTFQVQLTLFKKYQSRKYDTVFFIPSGYSPEAVERGLEKIRGDIEKTYGWLQLIGFIPVIMFRRLLGWPITNPMKGGVICSELVLQYLRGLDPEGSWGSLDKDTVSPEDLFVNLAAHPGFKVYQEGLAV